MKGPSVIFFLIIFSLISGLSILTFLLMRKVFPFYCTKKFSAIFWLATCLLALGAVIDGKNILPLPVSALFIELAVLWFMAEVVLLVLLAGYVASKVVLRYLHSPLKCDVDKERRRLLKISTLLLPTAALGVGAYGTLSGSSKVLVLQHELMVGKLAAALNGFKIAQISDVHLGLFFSVEKLRNVLERLLEHKPDVLVITGDLVDDLACLPQVTKLFNEYFERFPRGIWFSWGNHEYFRNFAAVEAALQQTKVRILRNEHDILVQADPPLYILGIDYPWAKDDDEQMEECRKMVAQALRGVPEPAVKVLLSHHTAPLDAAYEAAIDISLMGHTHGGQVALFGQTLLPVQYKYMRGMYRHNDLFGYVSAGTGSWFPFRWGCPAETAIFTLKSNSL